MERTSHYLTESSTPRGSQEHALAIEGLVCSGKSTLCSSLAATYSLSLVKEYMDFLPAEHPAGKQVLPADQRVALFTSLEASRLKSIPRNTNTILDRSFLSLIAFEYAIANTGQPSSLATYLDSSHLFLVPTQTFFLDVSASEQTYRAKRRGTSVLPLLLSSSFNAAVREFFGKLAVLCPDSVQFVAADTTIQVPMFVNECLRRRPIGPNCLLAALREAAL